MSSVEAFVSRRGRPTAQQAIAIEHAISGTARTLFLRKGYDVVSMEEVAATTGISKSTLYARFPSKSALFDAVVMETITEWAAESSIGDELVPLDIEARLRHQAHLIVSFLARPEVGALARLVSLNADRFPELADTMYRQGYRHLHRTLVHEIESAAARDGVPVRDPDSVVDHFISAITGWYMQRVQRGPVTPAEAENYADRAVELVMAARASW